MSIELDRPGRGVAAFMLSLSTLFALAWGSALDLLEQLHARLARDRNPRQPEGTRSA
jgi:hypothetical protein